MKTLPSLSPAVRAFSSRPVDAKSLGVERGIWRGTGVVLLALTSLGLSACKGPSFARGVGIELDRNFNDSQKQTLTQLSQRVATAQVAVPSLDSPRNLYRLSFASTDLSGVVSYLDERISVLVAPGDLESLLTSRLHSLSSAPSGVQQDAGDEDGMTTIATNIGTFLWMMGLIESDKPFPAIRFNGRKVRAKSMRSGIIQLDYGFFNERIFPQHSELAQLATLVHEARHSDCSGGMKPQTLQAISTGQSPESHACGHLHGICPEGHPLAGILACDVEAWGAYAIEAIYSVNVRQFCQNCGQAEKMALLMSGAESAQRVVPLQAMIEGHAGRPDLTSINEIRP